jgi:catechol 2,3-dioxygenase-like lactoylglutathione lyase family enzyme
MELGSGTARWESGIFENALESHAWKTTEDQHMSVQLNHTIVWCRDKQRSSAFLTEILGRPQVSRFGPFLVVELDNGCSLDFHDIDGEPKSQHYAFLIGEKEFDEIFARIRGRGMQYWADPGRPQPGEINHNDGGRGVYFQDPDGHLLEIITRPYGGG